MHFCLEEKTWPQIEKYLAVKKQIIVPVGSTEQHGPTGLIGTDYLTAWEIAKAVGQKTKTLVAPPLCFGMALHHLDFPGTISLTPITYIQVITEIIQSLVRHGFTELFFINGHGGNIAPLTSAFSQFLQDKEKTNLQLINWWHLPEVTNYESEVFADKNGFHATCGEISVTMHTHPTSFQNHGKTDFIPTPQKTTWPLSPQQFRMQFSDGRMGSQPELSTAEHGKKIFELAVAAICQRLSI